MVGRKIGGVNVFGGGLALFASDRKLVGGLGASGDLLRGPQHRLARRAGGFGHPTCLNASGSESLPAVQ